MGEPLAPGPEPTGRPAYLDGADALLFERRLGSVPTRLWDLLVDRHLARAWLGSWAFHPATGTIDFLGLAEGEDAEPVRYRLVDLVPGRLVEVATPDTDGSGQWRVRLQLQPEPAGGTRLVLLETVPDPAFTPLVGAAADYYLDRLVAVERGRGLGDLCYEDYVANRAAHYRRLFPGQRASTPSTRP